MMYIVLCAVDEAVVAVNAGLGSSDPAVLLQTLHNQYGGLQNVRDSNALHYRNILRAMKASKVEVWVDILYGVEVYVLVYTYYIHMEVWWV